MVDLNELVKTCHDKAVDNGFWESQRNFGEMLMLVTSELSEALEENRSVNVHRLYYKDVESGKNVVGHDVYHDPDTKLAFKVSDEGEDALPLKPEGEIVELVDAVIRLFDILGSYDVNVEEIILEKLAYNASRGHKHGKKY